MFGYVNVIYYACLLLKVNLAVLCHILTFRKASLILVCMSLAFCWSLLGNCVRVSMCRSALYAKVSLQ
jgi:hypothetical protein